MSQRKKDQVTVIYAIVLALFGIGLILLALYVFCLLSGPEIGTCMMDAVNPL